MTVKVKPARDRTLDLGSLRRVLAGEGVRMRKAVILADGDVERTADGDRFRIRGWPNAMPLRGWAGEPGPTRLRASVRVEDGEPVLRSE